MISLRPLREKTERRLPQIVMISLRALREKNRTQTGIFKQLLHKYQLN
jgi:hypothetical protein